ncbi:NADP-dependent oxidoreductase domain-containing protein [Lipomyces starkeyi]|uniref:NADP-dependent oxidoreductase domain-containing protein n=1 Tax=Lipomyces starkeyi NRRL Y-11557 TaxID=675824 RepID=A0A1E3Q5J0_LIPST|nr:hypothetical protein LIPSTDRAFT_3246 [Lipomyces starkeyi NRRL Y-11557]
MANQVKLIFGAAFIDSLSDETLQEFLDILENNGVKEIDTARLYTGSEKALGDARAPARFTIDTKAPAFFNGSLSKSSVLAGAKQSLNELGVEQVTMATTLNTDENPDTPLEETLSAIQEVFEAGTFVRFGLSNFTPAQVQEIYDIMLANGYVLPTVFQGNYNAVARSYESDLFPLLRKLGIRFYAYSPIAGGFLVKTAEAIKAGIHGSTRWDKNQIYSNLYGKPKLLAALEVWESIAAEAGMGKAALAYRWVTCHSDLDAKYGDADGPLPSSVAAKVDNIWEAIKDEAPVDNYHG